MVDYRSVKSHLARSGNSSCSLKNFILPARENIVQIKFLRKLKLIMPCCDDEEHSPSEFYCHGKTNDSNATFQGENNAEQNNSSQTLFLQHFNGFVFLFFLQHKLQSRTNCDPTKPYNKSLINLVCSVCTGKYCLRFLSHRRRSFVARSVRKPHAILSRTDLALG